MTLEKRLAARTGADVRQLVEETARYYTDDIGDASCVVAVADANGVVYSDETKAHDVYRVASLGKLMYAPVILNCGVDLSSTVAAACREELPPEWQQWTLWNLLRNETGLPREFKGWDFSPRAICCGMFGTHIYAPYDRREDFVRWLWKERYRRCLKPENARYSNMGYALLGMCLEDQTEKSSEELLQQYLVKPFGLNDTTFDPENHSEMLQRLTPCTAGELPWFTRRGHLVRENRLGVLRSTGGMFSSAADLVKVFMRLDFRDIQGLLRPYVMPDGSTVYYRHGMIYGGSGVAIFEPDCQRVTVLLRNATNWPDKEAFALVERMRSLK